MLRSATLIWLRRGVADARAGAGAASGDTSLGMIISERSAARKVSAATSFHLHITSHTLRSIPEDESERWNLVGVDAADITRSVCCNC